MLKKQITIIVLTTILFSIFSCKDEVLPKPASYLRLDYPEAEYVSFENSTSPFAFEINSKAVIKGGKNLGFAIS